MVYKLQTKEIQKKGIQEDKLAKAQGISLQISFKASVELARALKGLSLSRAYELLDNVIALKKAVPFRRYVRDIPHQKGKVGPGRFPQKAARSFKKVIQNAESNAVSQGLDSSSLKIFHISVDKGPSRLRGGRFRGRVGKSTHLQVILVEKEVKSGSAKRKPKAKQLQGAKKAAPKSETTKKSAVSKAASKSKKEAETNSDSKPKASKLKVGKLKVDKPEAAKVSKAPVKKETSKKVQNPKNTKTTKNPEKILHNATEQKSKHEIQKNHEGSK